MRRFLNAIVGDPVADPGLLPGPGDDSRFLQDLEMLGDVRLGELDLPEKVGTYRQFRDPSPN
jgi:hypothetical protein